MASCLDPTKLPSYNLTNNITQVWWENLTDLHNYPADSLECSAAVGSVSVPFAALIIAVVVMCFIESDLWPWVVDAAFRGSLVGCDTDVVVAFGAREEVQGADDLSRRVRVEGDEIALG